MSNTTVFWKTNQQQQSCWLDRSGHCEMLKMNDMCDVQLWLQQGFRLPKTRIGVCLVGGLGGERTGQQIWEAGSYPVSRWKKRENTTSRRRSGVHFILTLRGVPQGSDLARNLFILVTNDFSREMLSERLIYIRDTTLLIRKDSSWTILRDTAFHELSSRFTVRERAGSKSFWDNLTSFSINNMKWPV